MMLYRLADMLLYEETALKALSRAQPHVKFSLLKNAGLHLTTEPHFRDILRAVYATRLDDILRRTRVELDTSEGRIMMGIMDETGSLQSGQVFIQYSQSIREPRQNPVIHTGDVTVTKNPCFHPGDVRKFQAVDIEALHNCVDCIVFPSQGPRPHPNEISGSDLDGDMYFVTWAPGLQLSRNMAAMDYTGQPKKKLNRKVNEEDIQDFVAKFISYDQLGLIANSHLANADIQKDGIFSDICIQLAALHSIAVDFPKTGKAAEMKPIHRPSRYPDYMMKADKPHYRSKNVLGSLFRECQALEAAAYAVTTNTVPIIPTAHLDHPHKHSYLDEATIHRDMYNKKMKSIMNMYGIESEGELVSGCLTKIKSLSGILKNERFEISNIVRSRVGQITKNTRRQFFEEFGGEEGWKTEEMKPRVLAKASAWYYVSYNSQADDDATPQLLSFPWVISDVLAELAFLNAPTSSSENRPDETPTTDGAIQQISENIQAFDDSLAGNVQNITERIADAAAKTLDTVNNLYIPVKLLPIGSALIGMLHAGSDINYFLVHDEDGYGDEVFQHVADALNSVGKVNARKDLEDPSLEMVPDGCMEKISVTQSEMALRHSVFIKICLAQYPAFQQVLQVLHEWARRYHVIGKLRGDIMTSETLSLLFLDFALDDQELVSISDDEISRVCSLYVSNTDLEWSSVCGSCGHQMNSGEILMKFLKYCGTANFRIIPDPTDNSRMLCLYLDSDSLMGRQFRDCALQAYHGVACSSNLSSLSGLHGESAQRHLTRTLSVESYGSLMGAEDFNARRLARITGAEVSIRQRHFGETLGLMLEAWGDTHSIWRLEEQLQRIEGQSTIVMNARLTNTFVSESHETVLEGYTRQDDTMRLVSYHGERHPQHDDASCQVPVLMKSKSRSPEVVGQERKRFTESFIRQVQTVRKDYHPASHGDIRTIARFGTVYIVNGNGVESCSTIDEFHDEQNRYSRLSDSFYNTSPAEAIRGRGRGGRRGRGRGRGSRGRGHVRLSRTDWLKQNRCMLTSFIPSDAPSDVLDAFLEQYNFGVYEKISKYNLQYRMDGHMSGVIILDEDRKFAELRLSHFKWLAYDLKRQSSVMTASGSDVKDIRLTIQSRRILHDQEVKTIKDYEVFTNPDVDILRTHHGNVKVAPEFQHKVGCVRFKRIVKYRANSNALRNQFMNDVEVRVTEVDEYTRPDGTGTFTNVSRNRREITVIPKLPNFEREGENACEEFAQEYFDFCVELGNVIKFPT